MHCMLEARSNPFVLKKEKFYFKDVDQIPHLKKLREKKIDWVFKVCKRGTVPYKHLQHQVVIDFIFCNTQRDLNVH